MLKIPRTPANSNPDAAVVGLQLVELLSLAIETAGRDANTRALPTAATTPQRLLEEATAGRRRMTIPTDKSALSERLSKELHQAQAEAFLPNLQRWFRFQAWSRTKRSNSKRLVSTRATGKPTTSRTCDHPKQQPFWRPKWSCTPLASTIANQINPAVPTRSTGGQWHRAKKGASTTDADIVARRVIFIDQDARRPKGTSATDAQVAATHAVAVDVYALLSDLIGEDALGFGHSGQWPLDLHRGGFTTSDA